MASFIIPLLWIRLSLKRFDWNCTLHFNNAVLLMDIYSWRMVISYATRSLSRKKKRKNFAIQMCHHFWNMFAIDWYLAVNPEVTLRCMLCSLTSEAFF